MLAAAAVSVLFAVCAGGSAGCYDYESRTIRLDPQRITPYVVTHEIGHAFYFNTLTDQQRRELAVNDPAVRNEEAFADVFAACILKQDHRWMRLNGYRVRIGPARHTRICRTIQTTPEPR